MLAPLNGRLPSLPCHLFFQSRDFNVFRTDVPLHFVDLFVKSVDPGAHRLTHTIKFIALLPILAR